MLGSLLSTLAGCSGKSGKADLKKVIDSSSAQQENSTNF